MLKALLLVFQLLDSTYLSGRLIANANLNPLHGGSTYVPFAAGAGLHIYVGENIVEDGGNSLEAKVRCDAVQARP